MAIANLNTIDNKLTQIYENQVTTNVDNQTEDNSEALYSQMQFIAFSNKMYLNMNLKFQ